MTDQYSSAIGLDIILPSDRDHPGFFVARDDKGHELLRGLCLGQSDHNRACAAGNPSRNPLLPYGNTPTGSYGPTFVLPSLNPEWGPTWIPIEGSNGQALQAKISRFPNGELKEPRRELGIQAGGGSDELLPTNGNVRLKDDDFECLSRIIGTRVVIPNITEVTDPRLAASLLAEPLSVS